MTSSSRSSILFLALIGLGFLGWYQVHQMNYHLLTTSNNFVVSETVYQLSIDEFSPTGQRSKKIKAQKVIRYNDGAPTAINLPEANLFKQGKLASTITSSTALMNKKQTKVTLIDKVIIKQLNPKSTVTTSQLDYFPNKNKATTNKAVQINKVGLSLNAIGMEADLTHEIYTLQHKTTARYLPNKSLDA